MPLPTLFNLPEEKRQKILDCAIEEFSQHDYASASVSKIVARAGIAKGSLYQYFTDKSDLYRYLLEQIIQKKGELLANSAPPSAEMNLFDTLKGLFEQMAAFQYLYPKLAQIGYRAVYGKSPLPDDIVINAAQSTQRYFESMIESGKQRGEVRPEIDSSIAAFMLTTALTELNQYLFTRSKVAPGSPTDEGLLSLYQSEVKNLFHQIISILQSGIAS